MRLRQAGDKVSNTYQAKCLQSGCVAVAIHIWIIVACLNTSSRCDIECALVFPLGMISTCPLSMIHQKPSCIDV
jgi:hypothetical protein